MYSKKYKAIEINSKDYNVVHQEVLGKVCYLAYFKTGEKGWFLYEPSEMFFPTPVHRIHTSFVNDVDYSQPNKVIVTTNNTTYTFEEITEDSEI